MIPYFLHYTIWKQKKKHYLHFFVNSEIICFKGHTLKTEPENLLDFLFPACVSFLGKKL